MAKTARLDETPKARLSEMARPGAENTDEPKKIKVTHYITMDQVLAMDRIRAKRIGEGKSLGEVDKSRLMREALDLLIKQENV